MNIKISYHGPETDDGLGRTFSESMHAYQCCQNEHCDGHRKQPDVDASYRPIVSAPWYNNDWRDAKETDENAYNMYMMLDSVLG